MLKRLLKPAVLAAFVTIFSAPAVAQVHVDLPGIEIRVGHRAPPPLRREIKPHRPSRDHIWIAGAWDWQANDWAWVPGRWDRPGEHGVKWVRARYRRDGSAWRYEPGHWSNQRLIEGDDYRRWRDERDHGKHEGQDHDRRDHDHR